MQGSFKLKLASGTTIRGKFEFLIQERMIRSLNSQVALRGVVELRNNHPRFIRALSLDFID